MRIDFTGRQMDVTTDLRRYTHQHLRKLNRLLPSRSQLHVVLIAEKHRRIAEVTVKLRDQTLIGIEETGDAHTSIKGALDKLERQVVRWFQKRRTRKRRPQPTKAVVLNVLGGAGTDHEERGVIKKETIPLKPLSLEEAIESLDSVSEGVVVFRNPDTERVNIIYRRPDGELGLIEPES